MKLAMLIASNQSQQPLLLLDESFVKRCGLTTLTIPHTRSR
ncbi:hypothetical protein [Idiomarina abyssalis]